MSRHWTAPGRSRIAWLACVAGVLWFLGPAPWIAQSLEQARARSVAEIQLHDVILAIALTGQQDPASLPHGDDAAQARLLLERALVLDERKSSWPQRAAAVLGPAFLEVATQGADRPTLPRSRAHPNVPSELLALEQSLAARFGSWGGEAPPLPRTDLWSGLPPDDQAKGLLAVAELGELTEAQARGLQGAVMMGLRANDEQPALIDGLAELLGTDVLARAPASRDAPDPDLVPRYGPVAVEILRRRQASGN
jgi:hypothetical protein